MTEICAPPMGPDISGYPVSFLCLNLLLSPVGALLALALGRWHGGRTWSALALREKTGTLLGALLWLVATTHALYPATLVRHIADAPPPRPAWEALVYALAALAAFLLFHASLSRMREVLLALGAPRSARLVPFAAAPIITLGVLLGVARVDSWHLFTQLGRVARGAAPYLTTAGGLADWVASTLLAVAGFLLVDLLARR
jgi:hypothetical protein